MLLKLGLKNFLRFRRTVGPCKQTKPKKKIFETKSSWVYDWASFTKVACTKVAYFVAGIRIPYDFS